MVEQNGCNTIIFATDEAYTQLEQLEVQRIYDFEIPGQSVKNNSSSRKYGVFGPYEIRLRVPCTFSVSASAWPIVIPYAITPLSARNQCQHEAYVDVVGE